MLQYLLNYDVILNGDDGFDYQDLDISDRTILQEQINNCRKSYHKLIKLYDSLQSEYFEAKSDLSEKTRKLYSETMNRDERAKKKMEDQDISELEEKIDALKEAQSTVKSQMNFIQSDIKILTSSMYMK